MSRYLFIAGLLACAAFTIAAQTSLQPEIVKGLIVEKVVVAADKSQSYALYLPSAYDPSKKYPALYCFDPFGRGNSAIDKYKVAAEKYGYILVGSNNSRNGMDGTELTSIINNLWADTNQRYSIDTKRALAGGLSGGARVASSFAFSCNGCIFGVIGSGAGFSQGVAITEKLPFLFFGTTGYNDFNYPEMRVLESNLKAAHITHRIEAFDGGHQWLDESLSIEALAWFELRAMKAGRRAKDDALIEELFQKRLARADAYLADKKYLEAYTSYSGIVDDFADWRDISSYADKLRSLAASAELKQALKAEADQIRDQQQTVTEIMSLGGGLTDADEQIAARSQIHQKIEKLRKVSAEPNDSPQRRVARRCLDQIFVEAYESALFRYEREGKYDLELVNLELAGEVSPKNPQIPYNRARIFAWKGDKKKAVESLTKAVELGFKDAARITNEKAFELLQKDERFLKLLAALKQ